MWVKGNRDWAIGRDDKVGHLGRIGGACAPVDCADVDGWVGGTSAIDLDGANRSAKV